MEKRSASKPISATLMVAMSPARPPPTIMMRGFAMNSPVSEERQRRMPAEECRESRQPDSGQRDAEEAEHVTHHALRVHARREAPLAAEQPQAVREVERGAADANNVSGKNERVRQLVRHFVERHVRIF